MIRVAGIKDLDSINYLGNLFNDNFIKTYNINEYLNNNNYIILVNEDEIINGLMIVYKNIDYYELEAIITDPLYRNKKIATNLLNYLINNYLKTNDIILLEVAENNINAISLYKKFNFDVINIRKKYYKSIDAYIMKRVI